MRIRRVREKCEMRKVMKHEGRVFLDVGANRTMLSMLAGSTWVTSEVLAIVNGASLWLS